MLNVEQNIIKYAAENSIDDLIILLNYLVYLLLISMIDRTSFLVQHNFHRAY